MKSAVVLLVFWLWYIFYRNYPFFFPGILRGIHRQGKIAFFRKGNFERHVINDSARLGKTRINIIFLRQIFISALFESISVHFFWFLVFFRHPKESAIVFRLRIFGRCLRMFLEWRIFVFFVLYLEAVRVVFHVITILDLLNWLQCLFYFLDVVLDPHPHPWNSKCESSAVTGTLKSVEVSVEKCCSRYTQPQQNRSCEIECRVEACRPRVQLDEAKSSSTLVSWLLWNKIRQEAEVSSCCWGQQTKA